MTESREFYAATVQEAVEKAATSLNTDAQEVDFEVLDEGSAGFLGIGARDARIIVRTSFVDDTSGGDRGIVEEPASDDLPVETETEGPVIVEEEIERPVTAGDGASEPSTDAQDAAPEELVLAADGFVTELLERMGFDGTVDAHDAGEVIKVEVSSTQTGLFIGQKGETIDAIQYLLNVAVYKDRPFSKRIVVDTEGYRQRRVEAIQGMAHRIARRAQREKRPVSLPPMSAAERRVVHLFLKENPRVSTSSEGQDEDRRVVVAPI